MKIYGQVYEQPTPAGVNVRYSLNRVEAQTLWSRWHSPVYGTTVPGWNILLREQNGGKTLHFENLEQLTEYVKEQQRS
jgi:hypothetical protein